MHTYTFGVVSVMCSIFLCQYVLTRVCTHCNLVHIISMHSHIRYSRGMGIVGDLLGEDHFLNIPNSYGGLIFFPVMLVLGE